MSRRIRIAIGIALAAALMTITSALAKGGFDFITITGPDLREAIRITDAHWTENFFMFANFYEDKTEAPADPGKGYEITRYYIDGKREIAFDRLHYYPETGFIYYDGIVNGSSEYDGKWYTAKPEVESVFETALSIRSMDKIQSGVSTVSTTQAQPRVSLSSFYLVALATVGIALISVFAYRRRKPFSH